MTIPTSSVLPPIPSHDHAFNVDPSSFGHASNGATPVGNGFPPHQNGHGQQQQYQGGHMGMNGFEGVHGHGHSNGNGHSNGTGQSGYNIPQPPSHTMQFTNGGFGLASNYNQFPQTSMNSHIQNGHHSLAQPFPRPFNGNNNGNASTLQNLYTHLHHHQEFQNGPSPIPSPNPFPSPTPQAFQPPGPAQIDFITSTPRRHVASSHGLGGLDPPSPSPVGNGSGSSENIEIIVGNGNGIGIGMGLGNGNGNGNGVDDSVWGEGIFDSDQAETAISSLSTLLSLELHFHNSPLQRHQSRNHLLTSTPPLIPQLFAYLEQHQKYYEIVILSALIMDLGLPLEMNIRGGVWGLLDSGVGKKSDAAGGGDWGWVEGLRKALRGYQGDGWNLERWDFGLGEKGVEEVPVNLVEKVEEGVNGANGGL